MTATKNYSGALGRILLQIYLGTKLNTVVALLNMKEKDILELVNKVFCPRVRDKKEDIKKQLLLDKLNTAINKDLEANEEKTLKLTNEQLYALRSSVECNKANININITK